MQQSQCQPVFLADDAPLTRCYHLHALSLLAYVRQHVASREEAEDIVIEAFIAALEYKDISIFALDEREQLAWLRRVAYYKCIDRHRRSARQPTLPLEEVADILLEDESLDPEQLALRHEEHTALLQALSQLPEHYQTLLRLRFANGLHSSEIGRLLKKSEGAIRVSLSRALNALRTISLRQGEENHDEPR